MDYKFQQPHMHRVGKCLGCGRILISDVYSLCMRCAAEAYVASEFENAHPTAPMDELEALYQEIGGSE